MSIRVSAVPDLRVYGRWDHRTACTRIPARSVVMWPASINYGITTSTMPVIAIKRLGVP